MYNVIIVEDDPMVAAINRQYIEQNPLLCVTAELRSGKEALAYLQTHIADLAIVDYYMPIMNGMEFLQAVRQQSIALDFVMVTAVNDAATIGQLMQLGLVDYLIKPFEMKRFTQAMEKFITQRQIIGSKTPLEQSTLDKLLQAQQETGSNELLDKGLQQRTLDILYACLVQNKNVLMTAEDITEKTGLSRVTVRRYMNYLLDKREIISEIDYSTGGRPCIMYQLSTSSKHSKK